MSAVRRILDPEQIEAVQRSSARILAFADGLRHLAPVGQLCVSGEHGHCLACGARQGEPCRQPRT